MCEDFSFHFAEYLLLTFCQIISIVWTGSTVNVGDKAYWQGLA